MQNRKISPAGSTRIEPDFQERYGKLLAADGKAAKLRADRETSRGAFGLGGKNRNDEVNRVMRERNAAMIPKTQARRQCDACFRLFPVGEAQKAGLGSRICNDPACAERAKKWRFRR